uniref:Uncharacterized protein n=1 Tax=Romanomermis culicivorax TaxID=13658 RepID=A0A915JIJ2_ROMCU
MQALIDRREKRSSKIISSGCDTFSQSEQILDSRRWFFADSRRWSLTVADSVEISSAAFLDLINLEVN